MFGNNKGQFFEYFEQSSGLVLRRNSVTYLIFLVFLQLIDVIYLFYHNIQLPQILISKIVVNFAITTLIFAKKGRLQYALINKLLLFAKIFAIILLYLYDDSHFSLFLVLFDENEIRIKPSENILSGILIKIGFLVITIKQQTLLDIFCGVYLLLLEILKAIYLFKYSNRVHDELIQQQQRITNSSRDKTQSFRKVSNVHNFSQFRISMKEQKIINHNHNFCKIQDEEELNQILLEKIIFQIISFSDDREKLILKDFTYDLSFNEDILKQQEVTKLYPSSFVNLKKIISIFESNNQKNANSSQSQTFEVLSKFQWSENKNSIYSGQIKILEDEDVVELTLIDITKQYFFQEKQIKEQFKSTIVQSFSHELRTPLNSSLNFLQYCENDKSLSEEIKQNFISPAINALRLQSYLINDIIDFCQMSTDNLELDIQSFPIQRVVDEVNKLFKSALQMKIIDLIFDFTKNGVNELTTDYNRLMQIIANIIQNSIKFSSSGIILVKIKSSKLNYVRISVQDEGIGVTEDNLLKINSLIQNVDKGKFFSDFHSWHGLGLLISSMHLQRLKPFGQTSLELKSDGHQKGTKIKFFVRNFITTNQFSSVLKEQSKKGQSSRFAISIQSGSKRFSMNGSLVQLSEHEQTSKQQKRNLDRNFLKKATKNTNMQSQEGSEQNSLADVNFELQIGEFNNLYPFSKNKNNSQQREPTLELQINNLEGNIIRYQQIKNQDDIEIEAQMKKFFQNRTCTCRKILSVDDEIFNQKSIQYLLKQKGFDVILAYNGQEAIKLITETQKCSSTCQLFLLILMDYQMPIMNGIETTFNLQKMMKQKEIPHIDIIGLTAFSSKNDIESCLKSGMMEVLTKPLVMAEFYKILQQI